MFRRISALSHHLLKLAIAGSYSRKNSSFVAEEPELKPKILRYLTFLHVQRLKHSEEVIHSHLQSHRGKSKTKGKITESYIIKVPHFHCFSTLCIYFPLFCLRTSCHESRTTKQPTWLFSKQHISLDSKPIQYMKCILPLQNKTCPGFGIYYPLHRVGTVLYRDLQLYDDWKFAIHISSFLWVLSSSQCEENALRMPSFFIPSDSPIT